MRRYQWLRIVLLIVVIFGLGVVTGRYLTPKPAVLVTAANRQITAAGLMTRLTRELRLDRAEQNKLAPLLDEMIQHIADAPVGAPERVTIFREYIPKLRAQLRPEQHVAYDLIIRATERQIKRLPASQTQTNR